MASASEFLWYFDLVLYMLTKGISNDYVASVKSKTMTLTDIIASIISERTDLRSDTLQTVANLIDNKISEFVCKGYTVVMGNVIYRPTITGTFTGKSGTIDSDANKCVCSLMTTQSFKNLLAQVTPIYTGTAKTGGSSQIDLITDAETGATDSTITPGGGITVKGTKIKCVDADGNAAATVSFVNSDTGEATLVGTLITNEPSTLIFNCPSSLQAGSYVLRIQTYYSSSSATLKNMRTITSETLTVAGTTAAESTESTESTDTESTDSTGSTESTDSTEGTTESTE